MNLKDLSQKSIKSNFINNNINNEVIDNNLYRKFNSYNSEDRCIYYSKF